MLHVAEWLPFSVKMYAYKKPADAEEAFGFQPASKKSPVGKGASKDQASGANAAAATAAEAESVSG